MHYDICVVGHVTKDIVQTARGPVELAGGTAYYTAIALNRLGMKVAVVTKLHRRDRRLLTELEDERIAVFCGASERTTTFKNRYSDDTRQRRQWVGDVADPFTPADLSRVEAGMYHLGPLTRHDLPIGVIRSAAEKATISLDGQGFVRGLVANKHGWAAVRHTPWENTAAALAWVGILKADRQEATVLSSKRDMIDMAAELSRLGPSEVIITQSDRPSLVYADGRAHWIPAYPPRQTAAVAPTGCGDTYMAGYLLSRQKGATPAEAGRFAAMTATLKLQQPGPFRGSAADVGKLLR